MKKLLKGFTLIELLVTVAIIGILSALVLGTLNAHRTPSGLVSFSTQKAEACGFWTPCASDATAANQATTETVTEQLTRLTNAVPIPRLENSLERQNISKRLTLFSDPAKISYIYLTSYGKVMAFYTVKGKITSGAKRLTASDQLINGDYGSNGYGDFVTQAPELDGTYGNSSDYIFFWTTDGTYVQWSGEYMLADQPLQLTTQPELIRSVK